ALHVLNVFRAFLGMARVAAFAATASKEGAARGVGPGKTTKWDAVAVDVKIAAELRSRIEHLRGHDLAAVVMPALVPLERLDEPVVHADVEIEHDENRGLQPIREVERLGGKGKAL